MVVLHCEVMRSEDTRPFFETHMLAQSTVNCHSPKLEMPGQLPDCDVGHVLGCLSDLAQHCRGQFGRPACRFLCGEVPASCEGRLHPAVHHGGAQGMVSVDMPLLPQNVTMTMSLAC